MPEEKLEGKLDPTLYQLKKGVLFDSGKVRLTEKSKELIKKGKEGQRYVINEYIDLTTGERIQHWWPTVLEKIPNENEYQKSRRLQQEKLISEAGFDPSEVVKAPITGLTGVVHTRAKALDEKIFTGEGYAYIKQKKNRLGGSAVKGVDHNMNFIGRSTVNWDVFDLNPAFLYAFYYGPKKNLEPVTETWPTGIILARSLDWPIIQTWIDEIERIKSELNKETKLEGAEKEREKALESAKANCYPLIFPEVKEWKDLFELKEEERNAKLSGLWGKTIYIASGLKTIKQSSVVLTEEDIIADTLKTAKKYGIKINVDAIPPEIPKTYGATALMQAAYQGKNRIIELLLDAKADINARDHHGVSVMEFAIRGGNASTLKLLLKKSESLSALPKAILDSKTDNIQKLIESKIDIEARYTDTQFTAVHLAAIYDEPEALRILAENKADCASRDTLGRTPAHFAALYGKVDVIETLIKLGKINLTKDPQLLNELAFDAAARGHFNVIKLLNKKYGLSFESTNREGLTLAMVATQFGHSAFIKNLAENKANLTAVNQTGQSALTLAIRYGDANIVEQIVLKTTMDKETKQKAAFIAADYSRIDILEILNPDFSARNEWGETFAISAARAGKTEVIQYLIKKRVDISAPDAKGWTPLLIAASMGNVSLIQTIFSYLRIDPETELNLSFCAAAFGCYNVIEFLQPDLNAVNHRGETLATHAANNGQPNMIHYLFEKKADLTLPDKMGWTPLTSAAASGQLWVMEALLSKIPIDQETRMQLAFLAAANGHVNIMHLMMPLDFLAYNKEGATLVTCAAYHNKTNVLAYLAEQKADLSLSDHNGETAAFVAARENIPDVIKQLEAYGIDLNRECNGLTPGHIASAFNQTQALVALFDARAGLYQSAESRKDRDTPLQLAIKNRQFEAIRLLLDWETSRVFAEDWRTKKSPIDFADDEVKAFIILHQLKKYIKENKLMNEENNNIPAEQLKRIVEAEQKQDWVTALDDVMRLAEEKPKVEEKSTQSSLPFVMFAPPIDISAKEILKTYHEYFSSPEQLQKKLSEAEEKRGEERQQYRDMRDHF